MVFRMRAVAGPRVATAISFYFLCLLSFNFVSFIFSWLFHSDFLCNLRQNRPDGEKNKYYYAYEGVASHVGGV